MHSLGICTFIIRERMFLMEKEKEYLDHSHRGIWFKVNKKSLPEAIDKLIKEGNFFIYQNYFSFSLPMEESGQDGSYYFRIEFRGGSPDNLKFAVNRACISEIDYQLLTEQTEWQRHGSQVPENVNPVTLGVSKHCICAHPKNCYYCGRNDPDQEIYIIELQEGNQFILVPSN